MGRVIFWVLCWLLCFGLIRVKVVYSDGLTIRLKPWTDLWKKGKDQSP